MGLIPIKAKRELTLSILVGVSPMMWKPPKQGQMGFMVWSSRWNKDYLEEVGEGLETTTFSGIGTNLSLIDAPLTNVKQPIGKGGWTPMPFESKIWR